MHGKAEQGTDETVLRLVLDTNVWLDWLVFDDPRTSCIRTALRDGRVAIFIDSRCEDELSRVLAYPLRKRALDGAAQAACLAEFRRSTRRGESGSAPDDITGIRLPACRDPDDQKFLDLALACGADFLVTRDLALLELARRIARLRAFRIVDLAQIDTALAAR